MSSMLLFLLPSRCCSCFLLREPWASELHNLWRQASDSGRLYWDSIVSSHSSWFSLLCGKKIREEHLSMSDHSSQPHIMQLFNVLEWGGLISVASSVFQLSCLEYQSWLTSPWMAYQCKLQITNTFLPLFFHLNQLTQTRFANTLTAGVFETRLG